VTVSVGPSMKRGSCAVLMVSLRGVVMMPLSWLEVCVSDPIFAYSRCQLETNSVEMLAARSPQTSPGGALRNMFGLLLRLYYGQRRYMSGICSLRTLLKVQLIVRRPPSPRWSGWRCIIM
jgi:hypothetical protein